MFLDRHLGFFILVGIYPEGGVAGSYGSSIFNSLRNLYTVFRSDWNSLHIQEQHTRVLFSLHPGQHLFSPVFLVIVILIGMR